MGMRSRETLFRGLFRGFLLGTRRKGKSGVALLRSRNETAVSVLALLLALLSLIRVDGCLTLLAVTS